MLQISQCVGLFVLFEIWKILIFRGIFTMKLGRGVIFGSTQLFKKYFDAKSGIIRKIDDPISEADFIILLYNKICSY